MSFEQIPRLHLIWLVLFLTACLPISPTPVEASVTPSAPSPTAPPATPPPAPPTASPQPPTPTVLPLPTATQPPPTPVPLAYLTAAAAITLTAEIVYTPWDMVTALTWTADGSRLAVAAGQQVRIYDTGAWEEGTVLDLQSWANSLSYAPGLSLLAASLRDGGVQIWNADTGELLCTLEAHPKGSTGAVWSADGMLLATSGNDPYLRLWDVSMLVSESRCEVTRAGEMIGAAVVVPDVEFEPGGSLLASVDGSVVRLRDPASLRLVSTLRGEVSIYDAAFFPGRSLLVWTELGPALRVWDYSTGEPGPGWSPSPEAPLPARAWIWRLAVHPSGRLIAAGVSSGDILFWHDPLDASASTWSLVPAHGRATSALAFNPGGSLLATGGYDGVLRVWSVKTPIP